MTDSSILFPAAFKDLTGYPPFPWQQKLFDRFMEVDIPSSCNLPTGLGKTNVIAVWLIALANGAKVPRRLVYVVNRRTVVDQTTAEIERIRNIIEVAGVADALRQVCGLKEDEPPLAISTLRGQFADNREWSVNPSRPAVICGTVDMIGSRLLFSGYGIGFKSRPLHAGFLGQDALLVHDEAHLEPAFQKLITDIEKEQTRERERGANVPWPNLRVMQLTATTRSDNTKDAQTLSLTTDDQGHPIVRQRLEARKWLNLTSVEDDKQVARKIAEIAADHKDANAAVLVFVRTLEAVETIEKELKKTGRPVVLLTGTIRGKERDELVKKSEFQRFLKGAEAGDTVYLVCTSAGEVGIDISADRMVCDLSTFESMAQRLGRVNRYGDGNALIAVMHPTSFGRIDKKTGELKADEIDKRRQKTLDLLGNLPSLGDDADGNGQHDASPKALGELKEHITPQQLGLPVLAVDDEEFQRVREDLANRHIASAFAPEPTILPATDILFDAWAMTSIHQPMPGRPPVEPYLHGVAEWHPPDTYVAWREEVEILSEKSLEQYDPADLLDDYPLKPHELLRDVTDRKNTGVFAQLTKMAKRAPGTAIWIVSAQGEGKPAKLQEVVDGDSRRLYGATVILPPSVGGLTAAGTLDGDAPFEKELRYDVADIASSPAGSRVRVWSDDPEYERKTADMRRVRTIVIDVSDDGDGARRWEWYESIPLEGGRTAKKPVKLDTHTEDVENHAQRIVKGLSLPDEIANAVVLAAKLHDSGKQRERFQITLGNRDYPDVLLAKSGRKGARLPEPFRHEFASVLDAQADAEFNKLNDEMKGPVLHLIAAHHGRARPHFPADEAFDPEPKGKDVSKTAVEVVQRFARLQRRYGRWGLAYLESLLRAADWAASAEPSQFATETQEVSS